MNKKAALKLSVLLFALGMIVVTTLIAFNTFAANENGELKFKANKGINYTEAKLFVVSSDGFSFHSDYLMTENNTQNSSVINRSYYFDTLQNPASVMTGDLRFNNSKFVFSFSEETPNKKSFYETMNTGQDTVLLTSNNAVLPVGKSDLTLLGIKNSANNNKVFLLNVTCPLGVEIVGKGAYLVKEFDSLVVPLRVIAVNTGSFVCDLKVFDGQSLYGSKTFTVYGLPGNSVISLQQVNATVFVNGGQVGSRLDSGLLSSLQSSLIINKTVTFSPINNAQYLRSVVNVYGGVI